MNKKYEHIDINNEKVCKIVNAAFEVFSKNDLEKASTNSVVKLAGISRGLLYHYFKDKQDLFDFLVYFSIKVIVVDMENRIDWEDSDFINRIRQTIFMKFQILGQYPYMTEFFNKYSDQVTKTFLRDETEEIASGMKDKFYNYNLDFSLVKEGVDIDKMVNVIKLTLEGLARKYWDEATTSDEPIEIEKLMIECDGYIEFFRDQFYQ